MIDTGLIHGPGVRVPSPGLVDLLERAGKWLPLLLSILLIGPAWAAAETGKVVHVIDGDTLTVASASGTRTVRLIGVDTPELGREDRTAEFFAAEARAFAKSLADNRTVRLETDPEGDTRDKYGRALRYVYLPDGRLLNALIISQGYGVALTRFPFSKREEFRALERDARRAGRGLWASDALPALSPPEAARYIGSTRTVCGVVASTKYAARTRGQPTFLNLGRPYPDQPMTIVIWGSDRARFGAPERAFDGKRICVTGKIERYRGKPEVIVREPAQIEVQGQ